MKKRILSIFGTRPEAIKMAPVIRSLQSHAEFESIVCVTAQHRKMLDQELSRFQIIPDFDLNIMKQDQDLFDITANALSGLKAVFQKTQPDCVLVQGDTTTAMVGALAAFYRKIPVGHIEAGLRTNDLYSPYPEEANRKIVTQLAAYHFCPTERAKENLLKENISKENIFLTGNTVIDALLWTRDHLHEKNDWDMTFGDFWKVLESQKPVILVTGHRRENFGEKFRSFCLALLELAKKHSDWEIIYPVHLNPNVQRPVTEILNNISNIHLVNPMDYQSFIYLMNRAKLIITDSGGVQEEAPSLGKPVLVTRELTERPEAVETGTVILVGTDIQRIVNETESLMQDKNRYAKMTQVHNPYGDGKASERIIKVLKDRISSL